MILNSVRFPPLCDRLGFTNEIASFTSPCLCIFVVAYSSRLGIREPSMIHVTALRLFTIAPGRVRPFLFLYLKAAFICHISMYMQCLPVSLRRASAKARRKSGCEPAAMGYRYGRLSCCIRTQLSSPASHAVVVFPHSCHPLTIHQNCAPHGLISTRDAYLLPCLRQSFWLVALSLRDIMFYQTLSRRCAGLISVRVAKL